MIGVTSSSAPRIVSAIPVAISVPLPGSVFVAMGPSFRDVMAEDACSRAMFSV